MVRPRIRRECDLGNGDLAGWPVNHSALDAGGGDIGLQKMRTDTPDFFCKRAAGFADGAAGKHNGARGESAETVGSDGGVTVTHGNLSGIDAKLVGGDLRQRRLVTLAVVLHAHIDDDVAIRQHADVRGLVARYDAEFT